MWILFTVLLEIRITKIFLLGGSFWAATSFYALATFSERLAAMNKALCQ